MKSLLFGTAAYLLMSSASSAFAQSESPSSPQAGPAEVVRAGVAMVNITPEGDSLRIDHQIRDRLYVRAIVIRRGAECAVLVGTDQGGLRGSIVADAISKVGPNIGCSPSRFMISATHTHSGGTGSGGLGGDPSPARVTAGIVDAVTAASRRLEPVRISYATANLDLNSNRDFRDSQGNWRLAVNPMGHSDKTLAVLSLLKPDGRPLGVFMTYAMHPINFFMTGVISADFPGEASRWVETSFGDGTVAIFAQAASGNQTPRMFEEPFLASIRTGQGILAQRAGMGLIPIPPTAPSGTVLDMNSATNAPIPADQVAAYGAEFARNSQWVMTMGTLIGETVVDLIRTPRPAVGDARLWGGRESVRCPGRDRLDTAAPIRENGLPGYRDGADVELLVSLLRIGDVALIGVNGEVYSEIGERLKGESSMPDTMVVTLANGVANSGYIYADSAADNLTFEVIGSRLKRGCAEAGIVRAARSLVARSQPGSK